ncbi:MAG: hypothetical protein JW818_19665 [Pirellulales bacterium]|nr:hypothetical protein [Pirellulales bacterium]
MKRFAFVAALVLSCSSNGIADDSPPAKVRFVPFENINIEQIFSERIVREKNDMVCCGLIESKEGLAKFKAVYGIDVKADKVDFDKQTLLFGITNNISTRAFQLLSQPRIRLLTLDYVDSGERFRLAPLAPGKKYSHVQVFVLKKIERRINLRVKNYLPVGRMEVYN